MEPQVLGQLAVADVLEEEVQSALVLEAVVQLDDPGALEGGEHLTLDVHMVLLLFPGHVDFVHGLEGVHVLVVFLLYEIDFAVAPSAQQP